MDGVAGAGLVVLAAVGDGDTAGDGEGEGGGEVALLAGDAAGLEGGEVVVLPLLALPLMSASGMGLPLSSLKAHDTPFSKPQQRPEASLLVQVALGAVALHAGAASNVTLPPALPPPPPLPPPMHCLYCTLSLAYLRLLWGQGQWARECCAMICTQHPHYPYCSTHASQVTTTSCPGLEVPLASLTASAGEPVDVASARGGQVAARLMPRIPALRPALRPATPRACSGGHKHAAALQQHSARCGQASCGLWRHGREWLPSARIANHNYEGTLWQTHLCTAPG